MLNMLPLYQLGSALSENSGFIYKEIESKHRKYRMNFFPRPEKIIARIRKNRKDVLKMNRQRTLFIIAYVLIAILIAVALYYLIGGIS